MMRNRVLVFLWMTWIAITNADKNGHRNSGATKSDIYIAGFFALSQHDAEAAVGRGVMPAIRLALKHVNDNPNILHDYKLHLYYNDTQCSASVGMKAFFDMMDRQPHKLMILGGSCTPVTDPLAKTSKHWRISILSFADTHPMFEKKSYPNFFRVVPSEKAFSLPRLRLLQAFNWTRVGTLYQNEPRFSLAHNSLVSVLDMAAVEIAESQSFVDDLFHPLSKLKEKDVRIILANMNATWARRVFCEAYKAELYGRRYQWIVAGPRQQLWWLSDDPDPALTCTPQQIEAALQGAFLVDVLPLTSSTEPTVSGLTAQEYEAQYTMLRGSEYSQLHGYAYDAIWTVAQTVDAVVRRLKHRKSGHPTTHPRYSSKHRTIADFNYRDPWWETLFLDALSNISFHGVTGLVKFVDNERKGRLLVKQVQGRQEVQIAEYDSYTDTLQLSEGSISWIGGKYPPKDRTIEIIEPSRISFSVFAIFATASVLGIAVASAFLAINVRFRNQRNIKMSSPYLNNLIIVGCLLTYTSVILLGLDSRLTSEAALPIICTARIWTLMAGFTLAFGSMFSKTWRVHSIFTDVKLNKKAIKDYQLFMVVGVLLIIDVAILTTWQVIDPFYRETKFLEPFLDPTNEDVLIRPENEYCKSQYMTSFVGAIYAYKGLLMAFGCFLAWETRNVNIPALNDSKYIGMSVYNVVIMCVIGAAISYILSDQQDVSFIIISIFIIFCTTGTLCLVFVPKLLDLRQNPQGAIEKRNRATIKPSLGKYKTAAKADNELHKTRVRNAKMRKEIKAIDEEIQKLLQELGEESECVMVRDGPSVSVKGDSDGKAPSVSGVDTISLSSIISSPDPTFTSPSHVKDNGDHSPDNQNGSPSREMMSTAGVAMWTAISNPLLLISQVMRKSMELGETDPNSATAQCEYVIERHASPPSSPILVEEPPQGHLYAVESHEPDQLVDSDYRDSPEHLPLFRCACHAVNQAAGSISLDELHTSERWIKTQPRSFSLEIVQKLAEAGSRSRSRSRSASSFNYESEQDPRETDNYFEYQSLESLGSTPTECNSTCVNYDETETPTVECFPEPVLFFPPSYEVNHNSFHETLTVSETSQQSPKKLRQRKKRPRKKETVESGEDRDLNNHVTCSSQSTPDMTQRKRRLVAVENSILPIFQQLIVQKHQSEEEVSSQRMASCPNLSIKCDVVEYF